jgi:hypothetical protein
VNRRTGLVWIKVGGVEVLLGLVLGGLLLWVGSIELGLAAGVFLLVIGLIKASFGVIKLREPDDAGPGS